MSVTTACEGPRPTASTDRPTSGVCAHGDGQALAADRGRTGAGEATEIALRRLDWWVWACVCFGLGGWQVRVDTASVNLPGRTLLPDEYADRENQASFRALTTHYHELTALGTELPTVQNLHVATDGSHDQAGPEAEVLEALPDLDVDETPPVDLMAKVQAWKEQLEDN